jgi:hypothetical protein
MEAIGDIAGKPSLWVLRIVRRKRDHASFRAYPKEVGELRVDGWLPAPAVKLDDLQIGLDCPQRLLDGREVKPLDGLVIVPCGDAVVATVIAGIANLDDNLCYPASD